MTVPSGVVASIVTAELFDGPSQPLHVHHRGADAWQLATTAGRVVACLSTPRAIRLPHAIIVPALPDDPPPISVGDGRLGWGGHHVRVTRWFRPAQPLLPSLRTRVRSHSEVALLVESWRFELGRGAGLTPYGDDVLCGALVTLRAALDGRACRWAVAVKSTRLEDLTTATSAGLIRLAAHGWCITEVADVLTAVARGRPLGEVVDRLAAVGHTSGQGLLEGIDRVVDLEGALVAA